MKPNYFLLFLGLGLYSCNKEISNEVVSAAEVDVYVAGFVSDEANYHYPASNPYQQALDDHPVYWKNGIPFQLNYDNSRPNDFIKSARAYSIAVAGNDVYVAGEQLWLSYTRGPLPMGVCWRNGISLDRDSMNLWDSYEMNSLAVSNNDVYMAGWQNVINASYWKNDNQIELTVPYSATGLNIRAEASSIAVSGNDVYVAGNQQEELTLTGAWTKVFATYWKNGALVKLSDGSKDADANFITVSGNDVYVAGVFVTDGAVKKAQYWKNGTLVNLTDGSTAAEATSIAVSGADVYVAGTQWDGNSIQYSNGYAVYDRHPIAKYWKNGNPVNLTDGSKWAEARSIGLSGNDVYVAGFEDGVAKYWKNGNPVILGDVSKNSDAYSIFLVKK